MRVNDFIKKVTIPIVATILLFALFYPLCVNNGGCDYLKLWILMGIPFGIHRMFVWVSVQSDISPEETVLKKMYIDKLREAMENLPEEDAYLIYLLFFEEITVKEAAQICGCSRKTIQNRRKRILVILHQILQDLGINENTF